MLVHRAEMNSELCGDIAVGLSLGPGDQSFGNATLRNWKD